MLNILILSFFLFFSASTSADVYQFKDEDGNILYSDVPVPGGKRIKENLPSVAPNPNAKPPLKKKILLNNNKTPAKSSATKAKSSDTKEKKELSYSVVSISSPKHDVAFRDNSGLVKITVETKPALQLEFGHRFKLKLDGQLLKESWKKSSMTLENINRGSHTVQVMVTNKSGKTLKESSAVTFHLHRFSRLFAR